MEANLHGILNTEFHARFWHSIYSNQHFLLLSSQTDYEFYVQGDCGSGDLSNWQGPIRLTTPPTCGDNFGPYCYGAGSFTVFTAVASTPGDFITLNITAGETEV